MSNKNGGADVADVGLVRRDKVISKNPPANVMEDHNRKVELHKSAIRDLIRNAGSVVDDAILQVDGQYVGLFVLPNPGSVYIGFGLFGGKVAYRGSDQTVPYESIVAQIATYLRDQKPVALQGSGV